MCIVLYHGSTDVVEYPNIRVAKFKKPTHQISFHTVRALQTLEFVRGQEVNVEKQ